jgi:hypothetical protein
LNWGGEFSTSHAGEAAAGLLEKIAARLNTKSGITRFAQVGWFTFVVRRVKPAESRCECPFNREKYWDLRLRVRAELVASVASHEGLFHYSDYSVRSDQGFIKEAFLDRHKR